MSDQLDRTWLIVPPDSVGWTSAEIAQIAAAAEAFAKAVPGVFFARIGELQMCELPGGITATASVPPDVTRVRVKNPPGTMP